MKKFLPPAFGLVFLGIAALLYVTRYLCAGMICAGFASASNDLFNAAYGYVGGDLTWWAALSFLLGTLILLQDLWPVIKAAFSGEAPSLPPRDA